MATQPFEDEYDKNGVRAQKFEISNGDLEALKENTLKWNIKDESTTLRFALAILSTAKPGTLSIGGDNILPNKSLLKEPTSDADKQ